jgi:hypothetical protein
MRIRADAVVQAIRRRPLFARICSEVSPPQLHQCALLLQDLIGALGNLAGRGLCPVLKLADVGRVITEFFR